MDLPFLQFFCYFIYFPIWNTIITSAILKSGQRKRFLLAIAAMRLLALESRKWMLKADKHLKVP